MKNFYVKAPNFKDLPISYEICKPGHPVIKAQNLDVRKELDKVQISPGVIPTNHEASISRRNYWWWWVHPIISNLALRVEAKACTLLASTGSMTIAGTDSNADPGSIS